jgi:hypothetical protein
MGGVDLRQELDKRGTARIACACGTTMVQGGRVLRAILQRSFA